MNTPHSTKITLWLITLMAGLTGCGASNLSQSWQLDRLRLLGVQADPAEPQPGDTVSFSSLTYAPEGEEIAGVLWFACLPESASDFGCELDTSAFDALFEADSEELSAEELAELFQAAQDAGFVGYEPDLPPSWTLDADALADLSEEEQAEGISAMVNITVLPAGDALDTEDPDAVELAYKRVPVSFADTPNHNPELTGLTIEGQDVDLELGFSATVGQVYEIIPVLSDDSIEDYTYTSSDGEVETRTEEPYITWYTEQGTFDQEYSLYPESQVEWTAPDEAGTSKFIGVIRDRRGGMDWIELLIVTTE